MSDRQMPATTLAPTRDWFFISLPFFILASFIAEPETTDFHRCDGSGRSVR